jgi:hypothetical protein
MVIAELTRPNASSEKAIAPVELFRLSLGLMVIADQIGECDYRDGPAPEELKSYSPELQLGGVPA